MIKNITDQSGGTIGTLELPDSTPDDVWAEKLAEYQNAIVVPSAVDVARAQTKFGKDLLIQIGVEPEVVGLTTDQMVEFMSDVGAIQLMLMTGALATALATIAGTDFQSTVSVPTITKYLTLLANYLGLPVPDLVAQTSPDDGAQS